MVENQILPAAYQYSSLLAQGVASAKAAGMQAPQTETLTTLFQVIGAAQSELKKLDRVLSQLSNIHSEEEKAKKIAVELKQAMEGVRTQCDQLEHLVADEFWPLPKYSEMLFLS